MLELFVCARIRKVYIGLKVMLSPITKTIYNNKNRMEKHHISKRGHRMKKRNVITISCITVVMAVIIAAILFVNRKVSFDPAKTSQLCDELYDELHSFEEVYAGQYGKLTVENLPDIRRMERLQNIPLRKPVFIWGCRAASNIYIAPPLKAL